MEYWKFTPKSYYALGPVYVSKWQKALKGEHGVFVV